MDRQAKEEALDRAIDGCLDRGCIRASALLKQLEARGFTIAKASFGPGLNDDWMCDDHGKFGCRACMNDVQALASAAAQ